MTFDRGDYANYRSRNGVIRCRIVSVLAESAYYRVRIEGPSRGSFRVGEVYTIAHTYLEPLAPLEQLAGAAK